MNAITFVCGLAAMIVAVQAWDVRSRRRRM
jgi:hypothetical protein